MRLLIVTQTVDERDPVLGFFHGWIATLAQSLSSVDVICLQEGVHHFSHAVSIHSLGRERGVGRLSRLVRYLYLLIKLRRSYDAVLVHMNPEYVLAGGVVWRLLGKEIGMWYAHGSLSWRLRIALTLVHHVFTSTPHGFRISSPKVHIVGQGIDTEKFSPSQTKSRTGGAFSCVTVSRFARSKGIDALVRACGYARDAGTSLTFTIVGGPLVPDDYVYREEVLRLIRERHLEDVVFLHGSCTQDELPQILACHDCFLNAYANKSLDKALLEAMSVGLPTISTNLSYRDCVLEIGAGDGALLCPPDSTEEVFGRAIVALAHMRTEERQALGVRLRTYVSTTHGLGALCERILACYKCTK